MLRLGFFLSLYLITSVTYTAQFVAGDLAPRGNPDGQLNVSDLLVLTRIVTGLETATPSELIAADVGPLNSSPDGVLDVRDILILQRAILGELSLDSITVLPPTPILNDLSLPTTTLSPYQISGTASPGVLVDIYVNGSIQQQIFSDPVDGNFLINVYLIAGQNSIYATESDGQDESTASNTLQPENIIASPPTVLFSDNFESGLGNWINVSTGDNRDWTLDSGGTPSFATGPSSGADGSTNYIYFETSTASTAGDSAILLGPVITESNIHLAFKYHMYGSTTGTLAVDVLSNSSWINNIWTLSGQQQTSNVAAYTAVNVDLSSYSVSQIRFRVTAAGSFSGDIAIDDLKISANNIADQDVDGVPDAVDLCPATSVIEIANSNGCSPTQIDSDYDGVLDANDAFLFDPEEWQDTDADGVGNNADTDDDGDTVLDINDVFPLDTTESVDTDGDLIGNNADTDDDNDGIIDVYDDLPLNALESIDSDGDGIGNSADTDDDNDGISDLIDPYPLISGDPTGSKILTINIQGQGSVHTSAGSCDASCILAMPSLQMSESVTIISESFGYYFKDWPSNNCTNSNSIYYKQCDLDYSVENNVAVDVKFSSYPAGKLETGSYHTCYLESGDVFCWGAGEAGATSSFEKGQSIVPATLVNPSDIAASFIHTCVIDQGLVECWGASDYDDPAVRASLVNPEKIVAGTTHTCAQHDLGVTCWGDNSFGQLNVPAEVSNPDILAAGDRFTCALENNEVYCWGDSTYGKTTPPVDLLNPEKLVLSSAASHACVVDIGAPRCWGFNGNGEVDKPEAVTEVVDKVYVGGEWDSCVLYPDKRLICWKYNGTSISSIINPFGSFVSGQYHKCTLNRTISCSTSNNTYGQNNVPNELLQLLDNR